MRNGDSIQTLNTVSIPQDWHRVFLGIVLSIVILVHISGVWGTLGGMGLEHVAACLLDCTRL